MTIRGWLASCTAVLVMALPAAAQQSPAQVAEAYFAHFRAGEMAGVAALTHPRSLEAFRTAMLRIGRGDAMEGSPFEGRDPATIPADSFYLAVLNGVADAQGLGELLGGLQVQTLGHVPQGDSLAHVVYTASIDVMGEQSRHTSVLTLRRHARGWLVDQGDDVMSMMGGGLMMLMMAAGMQAGMSGMMDGDDDEEEDDKDPPSW